MEKQQLSERDICTKFITPALEKAGWDIATQIREEFPAHKGRVIVRGKLFKDLTGWRPDRGMLDKYGNEIEDRIYNHKRLRP